MRYLPALLLSILLSVNAFAEVDLRAPSATAPQYENETPQPSGILTPLTNLVTSYQGFRLPAHFSTCFAPSFQFLKKTQVLDTHCIALERHRATIGLIAVLMWAILGFSIIMSA